MIAEKDARQTFITDTWSALVAGTYPKNPWIKRKKAILSVVELLRSLGAGASLQVAMPDSLKLDPDSRGFFAHEAVRIGGKVFNESVEAFEKKTESLSAEVEPAALLV